MVVRRRLPVLLVLLAAAVAGCGGGAARRVPQHRAASEQLTVPTGDWKTDFSRHSVPLGEFASGGPGRDGIPPIDHPKAVSQQAAARFLSPREPVIVVEQGGVARAYPIQILVWHEIVNDTLAGRAIAVTYCPLCNSALVFDRRAGGRTLTFGTTGNLRNSDLVMWDRQTQSWWQQFTGEAVVGRLTGTALTPISSETLSFADFRATHPNGEVLSRDTGYSRDYGRNPYEGYDKPDSPPFLYDRATDDRLPPKERVAAVFAGGGKPLVVPFSRFAREPVIDAQAGDTPVVLLFRRGVVSPLDQSRISDSRDVGTVGAFDRRLDGRKLDFEARGDGYADRQTGSTWNIAGQAVSGSLRGRQLEPVRHDEQFWFALAAFVPDAEISK
jgi:hypothetical protein